MEPRHPWWKRSAGVRRRACTLASVVPPANRGVETCWMRGPLARRQARAVVSVLESAELRKRKVCVMWGARTKMNTTTPTHSRRILTRPPLIITVRSTAVKASAGSPLQHGMRLDSCAACTNQRFYCKKSTQFRGDACRPTQNARIPRPCPQSVASCCARRQPILLCPFDPLTSSCPPK